MKKILEKAVEQKSDMLKRCLGENMFITYLKENGCIFIGLKDF